MIGKRTILSIFVILLAYYYYKKNGFESEGSRKEGKIVKTKSGLVKGTVLVSRDGRDFFQWAKIPFAQPPIGSLRFASPKRIGEWQGILDGSKIGPRCAQLELVTAVFDGEEDCLHLNIFAPKLEGQSSKKNLPVMVWIHGGAFSSWSAADFGPHYFMDFDVVLVTINYRLGPLGFFSTGDKSIRGNMGLKDQVLALEWIKTNIESFGGNSNQITIFGESAGGASVHHMMLSPKTRGLFHKAISQSGTALAGWATVSTAKGVEKTKILAKSLNCPIENSQQMTECLRKLSPSELLASFHKDVLEMWAIDPSKQGELISPVIEAIDDDEAFLTRSPYEILTEGKAHKIPWMSGITLDEGLLATLAFYRVPGSLEAIEKEWDKCVNTLLYLWAVPDKIARELSVKIRQFYFPPNQEATKDKMIESYTRLLTDFSFHYGMRQAAMLHRQFSPVYLYHYTQTGGPGLAPALAEMSLHGYSMKTELTILSLQNLVKEKVFGTQPKNYGSCHTDELSMLFPMMGILNVDSQNLFYKFSKDFVKLWVSFATDETSMEFRQTKFPPVSKEGRLKYLKIDQVPQLIDEPHEDRLAFWRSTNITELIHSHQLSKRTKII